MKSFVICTLRQILLRRSNKKGRDGPYMKQERRISEMRNETFARETWMWETTWDIYAQVEGQ
jgi:hypothetical protein